ncbi:hypothetical protein HMPREF0860_1036 [Treponema socranskii subsp. socranskii VPI DR56BR1116 = ATCC 35536]|uniref:Uncharacterized protein n=1 Tax=Treponema socranskii subsp. socranskii VPI DR56BR1116 = ATCC 35536 TaxID=1125725 RepID=U2MFP4_TRESO|nr:hypothetical protein [Treponema socranskii]ERF61840.1 hypothetical protein HMPREF1325_1860 [Treponema socranskii subsp. socranskii VPI DR56BR1116 = ATCC 35536]ERK00485.1 hypothetical protein HMPREF0860_1036 [Treponema socranskii subsp. socranskii VPI DR56BR1116 = ATCC 35536]
MKATYLDIRNSVVEQIQAAFANDKRVKVAAHPGNFDEGEIRRLMQTTPAILTSLVGINDEDVADECYIDFVSWVLHRADNKDRLYDGALSLVSALVGVIKKIDNPVSYGGGTKINAQCLYTGSLDKINATLWAVRWCLMARAVYDGGITLPDDLDWFKGYDGNLVVEKQTADDIVNLE